MASREIVEAAGVGDQPPCRAAGLFFTDADVVVEEPPYKVHELRTSSKTLFHKVLNGPAKYRMRIYNAEGILQEEIFYNISVDKPVWKQTLWHKNGIIARLCGHNNNGHYHGTFFTSNNDGRVRTNHVLMNGRRVYEHEFDRPFNDDQVFVAVAFAKEVKKLKKGVDELDVVDNN